eukprot:TRINITY_DN9277_c0_g1_i1.p1 TRINITY_DN9277_c0_g1~~TRINITY_DN9277_c0_g1_i1.p1  ORF type:complete len:323 (+),score=82.89 TRINITY_DN9277_c0_g1_i1:73-1041(+)
MSGFVEVQLLELRDDFIRFKVSNCPVHVANSLRRVLISEVPTVAFDIVRFEANDSPFHDEFLAHRIGMIPINCEREEEEMLVNPQTGRLPQLRYKFDCTCADACEHCQTEFTLNVDCTEESRIVSSKDLTPADHETTIFNIAHTSGSHETSIFGEDAGIEIVKLGKGQKLHATCVAQLGSARVHSKWSPVCTACFRYVLDVALNPQLLETMTEEQKRQFIKECQPGVFEFDEIRRTIVIAKPDIIRNAQDIKKMAEKYKNKPEDDDLVHISNKPGEFIFEVETTGAMKAKNVVKSALNILAFKMKEIRDCLDEEAVEEDMMM